MTEVGNQKSDIGSQRNRRHEGAIRSAHRFSEVCVPTSLFWSLFRPTLIDAEFPSARACAGLSPAPPEQPSPEVTNSCARQMCDEHCLMRAFKPIELLVPVSYTPCSASTPGLSTWWSSTALEGELVSR